MQESVPHLIHWLLMPARMAHAALSHCAVRSASIGLLAVAAAAASGNPTGQAPPATSGMVTAFVGVNVVPMDRERILERQTVIVRGERIETIGSADDTAVPDGARRIEAQGKYLMPGLAEMHAHIPTAQQLGAQWQEQVLFLYVANGVTTIRGMLGQPEHLKLREQAKAGTILGPRIYTAGPAVSGKTAPSPEEARRLVRDQKQAGYDFMKLATGISREAFDALVDEAKKVDIEYAGHVSLDVGLHRALEARQITIDHLDGYIEALVPEGAPVKPADSWFFGVNLVEHADEKLIPELAAKTKAQGVWNVPTQSLFVDWLGPTDPETLRQRPDIRYIPPQVLAGWMKGLENQRTNPHYTLARAERLLELRRAILSELHRAGAGLLLGSDAPQVFNVPGFSVHQELETLIAAGLTPYEALATGTRNVAQFFGAEQEYGTVEEGRGADLILLDANPLDSVSHVQRRSGVMVRGQWLPESEIQQRLDAIARAHAESSME
jgi:imidazolonepropionase-like amidohydrolase